jgi:hypothetical protein
MLKIIIFMFTPLLLISCYSQNNNQSVNLPKEQNKETTKLQKCSQQPKNLLQSKNVETLDFKKEQTITKSKENNNNDTIGYQFQAQEGQTLNYQTNNEVCIWIYSAEAKLLEQSEIPETGEYIMQISTVNLSGNFEIEITLSSLSAKAERSNTNNSPRYSFTDFPKSSCGDSLPQNEEEYPISFYAVDISHSKANLKKVRRTFCQDAFVKIVEGKPLIQVASFKSIEQSEDFANFVRTKIENTKVRADSKTIVTKEMFNNAQ